jgi:hypothetical protein
MGTTKTMTSRAINGATIVMSRSMAARRVTRTDARISDAPRGAVAKSRRTVFPAVIGICVFCDHSLQDLRL